MQKYANGTKVVPFQKTAGWCDIENSILSKAKEKNQNFLFIVGYNLEKNWYKLSYKDDDSGADFFNERDFLLFDPKEDKINHPIHYTEHPSGIECIQITEHMNFCLGNAVKYIWRADLKNDAIEDLKKAIWYIEREIKRRKNNE